MEDTDPHLLDEMLGLCLPHSQVLCVFHMVDHLDTGYFWNQIQVPLQGKLDTRQCIKFRINMNNTAHRLLDRELKADKQGTNYNPH